VGPTSKEGRRVEGMRRGEGRGWREFVLCPRKKKKSREGEGKAEAFL